MAKGDHVKALTMAQMHLRDCAVRPTAQCKECMTSLVMVSNALAEALDVGDAIRKLLSTAKPPLAGAPHP